MVPLGVIHGRFQILHNDHLKYLLSGKELCEHLVVGITNPDPFLTRTDRADPGRSDPFNNPLTFWERYQMVRASLTGSHVPEREFSIVGFPINLPEHYHHWVPMEATFFVAIYDDWGRRKKEMFENLGLRVQVLREVSPQEKGISASQVRSRILNGRPWEAMVPPSTRELVGRWDIPARLRRAKD